LFLFIAGIEKVQRGAWAFQNPSQPPILWQLDQLAAQYKLYLKGKESKITKDKVDKLLSIGFLK
jgi:hypothetical protein